MLWNRPVFLVLDCPAGATSSRRSPRKSVDSYLKECDANESSLVEVRAEARLAGFSWRAFLGDLGDFARDAFLARDQCSDTMRARLVSLSSRKANFTQRR